MSRQRDSDSGQWSDHSRRSLRIGDAVETESEREDHVCLDSASSFRSERISAITELETHLGARENVISDEEKEVGG